MKPTRARRRYPLVSAGEWVQPNAHDYRMKCCDCGLIHSFQFRVVKYAGGRRTKVQFRAWRVERGRRVNG